ncbi:ABC transporter permease [Paenibacillus sp. FSL L8-0333]|uniref:ABC transporter permease n=1 Tax=unclassified Paenibacillus TaxID=185978 RepID=UPI0030D52777
MSIQNKTVMIRIAKANLKAEKTKNYFVGSVIALAAFLLTVVMTFGYNSFTNLQNESNFQALFYNLNNNEISRLKEIEEINKIGLYKEIGREKKEERLLSILYTDPAMMDLSNANIVLGKFPTKENEIAIEKDFQLSDDRSLGLGDSISLQFRNNASKEFQTSQFVITGILQTTASGNENRIGYNALVSSAFVEADPFLSKEDYSAAISINNSSSYSNEELKSKIKEIGQRMGIPERNIQINNVNVDSNNLSGSTVITILSIMLIIVLACWLVIYNIFYISITKRIKQYGQLRAIGATKKQIKQLVLYEGKNLSRKYIPIGVIFGCLMSWILSGFHWNAAPSFSLAFLAGLLTKVTVRASLNAPSKFASRISPITAIRHVDADVNTKKEKRNSKRLTPFSLAALNLSRSRKKTVLTLLSLFLSGTLFVSLGTLLNSVDPISKAEKYFPNHGQFDIQINNDLYSETTSLSDLQTEGQLSTSLKNKILAINEVEDVIEHQYIEAAIEGIKTDDGAAIVSIENIPTLNNERGSSHLAEGKIPDVDSSDASYILLNSASSDLDYYGAHYAVGDHISFIIANDQEKAKHDFEIIGDIPDKNSGTSFYLPPKVMQTTAPFNSNKSYEVITMDKANEELIKSELEGMILNEDTLKLLSFSEVVESNRIAFRTITISVYSFMVFIAVFSMINLLNTIITTISARKGELGLMQAIGMGRKQLMAMLTYETGFLVVGSFTMALVTGNLMGYMISKSAGNMGGLSYIQYQFPWSAIFLYFLVILLVQTGMVQFVRRTISKQSIIEQLN